MIANLAYMLVQIFLTAPAAYIVEVNEAVRIATGRNPTLGNRLMTIDSGSLTFDFFDIGKSEDCPICSKPVKSKKTPTKENSVTQLCSQSFNISPPKITSIDLKELAKNLEKTYTVKSTARSVLVTLSTGEKVTLMASGSAIIKGVNTANDAIRLYELILNKNA